VIGEAYLAIAPVDSMTKKSNKTEQKTILIVNAEPQGGAGISLLLKETDFKIQSVASLTELKKKMKDASFFAVIMDLDSVALDNRSIRDLAYAYPTTPFLCISKERFHPELKDSIRDHIYACLTKPIDPDELGYWLKCIREDEADTTAG
jgi:DNA-binding NtrC family response regulator